MLKQTFKLCLVIALALISCNRTCKGVSDSSEAGHASPNKAQKSQVLDKTIVVSGPNELKAEKQRNLEKQIVVTGPNDIKLELVYIQPGSFIMGRNTTLERLISIINFEASSGIDEGPPRKVTITRGFYIGKYKVTVGQYCKFLNSPDVNQPTRFLSFNYWSRIIKRNGRFVPREPELRDSDVSTVHWEGSKAFCDWLSKSTGRCFRLPTEAEWEFAIRSPEGLHSRGGSDWFIEEWVSDYYTTRYPRKDEIDPTGPKAPPVVLPVWGYRRPGYRVLRRGSTSRDCGFYADDAGVYGFRVLMEVDKDQRQQKKQPQSAEKTQPPIALNAPVEFQMRQRSTVALPGSNDRILITIGDITRGRVMMSLSWRDGNGIVPTRSMWENDRVVFVVDGHSYKIKLKQLMNVWIGEDTARFELSPAATESAR